GIASRGEGDISWTGPAETLAYSFYAAGPVKSEPTDGKGGFGLYWPANPPFAIADLGPLLRKMHGALAAFATDNNTDHPIFIRENPYPSGGGPSLPQSFMFGYGAGEKPTVSDLQMLLAHEMAHNWPRLDDDEHPLTAWYTEGSAEYYSLVLSQR